MKRCYKTNCTAAVDISNNNSSKEYDVDEQEDTVQSTQQQQQQDSSTLQISRTRTDSSSFRIKDGLLIEEIHELTLTGGQHVPSSEEEQFLNKNEDEMTFVDLPAPEAEARAGDLKSEISVEDEEDTSSLLSSPCELDWMGRCKYPGKVSQCRHSLYKSPKDVQFIRRSLTPSHGEDPAGGLLWKATIVPDDFDERFEQKGTLKMCHKNNYDAKHKCLKPRRGNLLVKSSDFFGSLVKIDEQQNQVKDETLLNDDDEKLDDVQVFSNRNNNNNNNVKSRWVFSGVLCGWPALKTLEVLKIEYKRALALQWRTHWNAEENVKGVPPSFPTGPVLSEVRAILRMPPYTMSGWSPSSPGFVFWFEGNGTRKIPRLTYGTDILKVFQREDHAAATSAPRCIRVHMISHRYATGDNVQIRDRLAYHSLALLEWDHGKYCTVVELAYLGGIGGYNGQANWVEDKLEPCNSLYKCLPPEMIHPWKSNLSEIRVFDVQPKTLEEFMVYMNRHTGKYARFLNVQVTVSLPVRLTFSSREHIAQYLINYIRRGKTYSEIRRNCQTFAADFCAFLAGKKDIQPFHPINQQAYRNQAHYFLYEPTMYPS
jgi:PPPDE putative peptidase domain.